MRSFQRSIAVKNGVVYLIILLFACAALGTFLFIHNARTVKSYLQDQVTHTQELIKVDFEDYIEDITRNVGFLAEGVLIRQVLTDPGPSEAKDILSKGFLDLLIKNPDYSQVRLIGAANQGMEVVRADRLKGTPKLLPDTALQRKADRSYFKEAQRQAEPKVIFSQIDLNKEYGVISEPPMPTLRAYYPIIIDDGFTGLVVINLDLSPFFQRITSFAGPGQVFHVFTNHGEYLIHPNPEMTFGFEYDQSGLAKNQLDQFHKVKEKSDAGNQFFQKWEYPRKDYFLVCALAIDETVMNQPLRSLGFSHLLYFLLILGVAALFVFFIVNRQSRFLSEVTRAMAGFNVRDVSLDQVAKRKDEFGDLASAFAEMQSTIKLQIEQLTTEKAIAQRATQDKEAFIENMSHELRNPLQNIKGMLSVLEKNKLREDQKPVINAMTFSAGQLEVLINDVLDFGLLKEGKIALVNKPVRLKELVTEIVQSHRFEAGLKAVAIELEGPAEERDVLLDPTRFTQIVSNLLSNAVKFSDKDSKVIVSCSLKTVSGGNDILEMEIKDEGRGMSKAEVSQVLKRYERLELDKKGAGLGLPVVQELLKLFGSQLKMSSEAGKGTICSFSLSLEPLPSEDNSKSVTSVVETGFHLYRKPRKVLIIEDDPQLQHLYAHFFQADKYDVHQLQEWAQWKAVAQDKKYDLICSDVNLGAKDLGLEGQTIMATLHDNGLLLWVTGGADMADKISPHATLLVKPISKLDLIDAWNDHWVDLWNQPPVLDSIYADYDHVPEKVARALDLLIQEWDGMINSLVTAFKKQDLKAAGKVYHRMTTTLKRLKLYLQDKHIGFWLDDFEDERMNDQRAVIIEDFGQRVLYFLKESKD